ncbi:MAG: hypothetical protein P4L98_10840 [Ancalomicrobiaceae bacterium]|nr:hypothetical protein [Ancalomicrobiaceae bacterium]
MLRRVFIIAAMSIAFAASGLAVTAPADAAPNDLWLQQRGHPHPGPQHPGPQANAPRFNTPHVQVQKIEPRQYSGVQPRGPGFVPTYPGPRGPHYVQRSPGPHSGWYDRHHHYHPRIWAVPVPYEVDPGYTYQDDDPAPVYSDDYVTEDDGNCHYADRNVYDYDQNGRSVLVKRRVRVCD